MGGNSSYSKGWGGVLDAKRTHDTTKYQINKIKVVVTKNNPELKKNILNSNTENTTYLIAKKTRDGAVKVESINVYNGHNLSYEVNLIFDDNGNVLPFNNGKGSHAHLWEQNPNGYLERKSHDKKNSYPIDLKYDLLIKAIEKFNKQKNKL